ncbi:MAG: HNH endonuclease [Myxococcota bacterium]
METLVLSHAYQPVDQVSWQRAITLWAMDKVEILEAYDDRVIRSVSFSIQMPSVVRFIYQIRTHRRGVRFSRENVYARDKGRCQYCREKITRAEATYDHVIPRSQGGTTRWDNIVIACLPCNQKKGGRTPEQAHMRLHTPPERPKSLPPSMCLTLPNGVPDTWRQYLYDLHYWNGRLDED